MNCEKYQMLIQEFLDGELDKKQELEMFAHLSECEECRVFMKHCSLISGAVVSSIETFPDSLERTIFTQIDEKFIEKSGFSWFKPAPAIISLVFSVILIIVSVFLFVQSSNTDDLYKDNYRQAMQVIYQQNKQLDLLLNSMSTIQVTEELKNKVIIKPNL